MRIAEWGEEQIAVMECLEYLTEDITDVDILESTLVNIGS